MLVGLKNTQNARDDRLVKRADDLMSLFSDCFFSQHNTILVGGAAEPLYEPAAHLSDTNKIYYRHDYFSSALHEIAHWCIAGEQRRTQVDYGYWYAADGRNAQQQTDFEQAEVKPQALEWAFSLAANVPFRVSIDNLNAVNCNHQETLERQESNFTDAVKCQLDAYLIFGFNRRAQIFLDSLHAFYHTPTLSENRYAQAHTSQI